LFIFPTLKASKAASVASQKTKEFGQTVNASVIKPTKEKVESELTLYTNRKYKECF